MDPSAKGGSVSGFTLVHLQEIPARDTWIPIRDHLGVEALGVNAYRAQAPSA
jgi:hypothetical protein